MRNHATNYVIVQIPLLFFHRYIPNYCSCKLEEDLTLTVSQRVKYHAVSSSKQRYVLGKPEVYLKKTITLISSIYKNYESVMKSCAYMCVSYVFMQAMQSKSTVDPALANPEEKKPTDILKFWITSDCRSNYPFPTMCR